jgi:hypothetical protein
VVVSEENLCYSVELPHGGKVFYPIKDVSKKNRNIFTEAVLDSQNTFITSTHQG